MVTQGLKNIFDGSNRMTKAKIRLNTSAKYKEVSPTTVYHQDSLCSFHRSLSFWEECEALRIANIARAFRKFKSRRGSSFLIRNGQVFVRIYPE